MTIETVIDWLTTTNSLGVPNYCNVSTWVVAAILWGVVTRRWLAGRRKKRELEKARWELFAGVCALPWPPAEPPKPAPDRQYQGDQVSGIRKELMALEERLVTRAEWDKGHQNLDEWVDLLASGLHTAKAGLVRLEERVGRMEAAHYSLDWIVAQQMRDPHFEPVGTQPVEGDIVFNPDKKRYSIVESVSDEVYLDDGGSYHCWAFMSPAVVPDDRFGGEQRPRVLRRNPQ